MWEKKFKKERALTLLTYKAVMLFTFFTDDEQAPRTKSFPALSYLFQWDFSSFLCSWIVFQTLYWMMYIFETILLFGTISLSSRNLLNNCLSTSSLFIKDVVFFLFRSDESTIIKDLKTDGKDDYLNCKFVILTIVWLGKKKCS